MIRGFEVYELVPEAVYKLRGERSWQLLDQRALKTLEWLRGCLGACTVNDWKWGGSYSQSGLRTFEFYLQGSNMTPTKAKKKISDSLSQHKYGRGFDCKFKKVDAESAREYIKKHWHKTGFDWAITLEEGVSWLHFDVRTQPENKVYTFNP